MDPSLADYRERQRQRFEASRGPPAPVAEAMAEGVAGGGGNVHVAAPAVSAEALRRQLASALLGAGEAAAAAADAPAAAAAAGSPGKAAQEALGVPSVRLGLLQWALLQRLEASSAAAAAAAVAQSWAPLWQALSCLGSEGRGGGAAADSGQPPGLGRVLASRVALEALLLAGGCSDWPAAVAFFCALVGQFSLNPSTDVEHLQLRLAAASALCYAEGETDENMHESPIDQVERFRCFCCWAKEGRLFRGFHHLTSWHLRYVVGSWHADRCLEWAQESVDKELRCPDKIGRAAQMVTYRDFNDSGVSVQEGLRFYDGKKSTMPVMRSYGGVCGAISKFGASACQAFGVPAMPVGQPGHCAMIWRGAEGEWLLENDNSGLGLSRMHTGIQRTWKELGELCEEAGIITVMEEAQALPPRYLESEVLRLAAPLVDGDPLALALTVESVAACPYNLPAWAALLRRLTDGAWPQELCLGLLREQVLAKEASMHAVAYDVSLVRPVASSGDQDRAPNIVDGTSSEWFPASTEPQWLEIDLQRPCIVDSVRVQWWGDYGTKSSLQVLSSAGGGAEFVRRSRREHAADFNGWSDLRGWVEPTRFVRLELGNPQPDCFGLGKQYGIRQVRVMGRRSAAPSDAELGGAGELLSRWVEAAFSTSRTADIQAQSLVKRMLASSAAALEAASASSQECVIS